MPGYTAPGRQLLSQFQPADVPVFDLVGQSDQLRVLLGSELLSLAFGLEVVVALPCRLRKPLLDLLQQIAVRGRRW